MSSRRSRRETSAKRLALESGWRRNIASMVGQLAASKYDYDLSCTNASNLSGISDIYKRLTAGEGGWEDVFSAGRIVTKDPRSAAQIHDAYCQSARRSLQSLVLTALRYWIVI
jgi:hypothetical protein